MKLNERFIKMTLYWALYLTLTMSFFEMQHITPERVGGVFGWIFVVEVPRVVIGFLIQKKILK